MSNRTQRLFLAVAEARKAPSAPGTAGMAPMAGGAAPPAAAGGAPVKPALDLSEYKPEGMTWHDYLILLLQVGAEIEHGLMVQYLYAAYSLGGPQVPEASRPQVRRWQESILTIAREEMGHLIAVQNLLVLLGGPVSLARQDYPWDSPFYPFPFQLEPVTLDSLACYIYAEMPPVVPTGTPAYDHFHAHDKASIDAAVRRRITPGNAAHHVDEIYESMIEIMADRTRIPDSAFNAETYSRQMSWDEWAKGYGPQYPTPPSDGVDPAGTGSEPRPPSSWPARVIVPQMATRTMAVDALKDIAGQGEGPHLSDTSLEPSHFDRFLEVYQEFEAVSGWSATRRVVINPTTVRARGADATFLEAHDARSWANLFNLRYRMLLTYLAHMYALPVPGDPNTPSARPGVLHRVFAEMFNVKTIAGIMMRLPAGVDSAPDACAGPPFEMPYTLDLPGSAADRWRMHRDLHTTGLTLTDELLRVGTVSDGVRFLTTLRELDQQSLAWLQALTGETTSSVEAHS